MPNLAVNGPRGRNLSHSHDVSAVKNERQVSADVMDIGGLQRCGAMSAPPAPPRRDEAWTDVRGGQTWHGKQKQGWFSPAGRMEAGRDEADRWREEAGGTRGLKAEAIERMGTGGGDDHDRDNKWGVYIYSTEQSTGEVKRRNELIKKRAEWMRHVNESGRYWAPSADGNIFEWLSDAAIITERHDDDGEIITSGRIKVNHNELKKKSQQITEDTVTSITCPSTLFRSHTTTHNSPSTIKLLYECKAGIAEQVPVDKLWLNK